MCLYQEEAVILTRRKTIIPKVTIRKYLVLLFAMLSFLYTIYVVKNLAQFLSTPRKISITYYLIDARGRLEIAYWPMVFDTLYLDLFIVQHSCMKSAIVRNLMRSWNLVSAERAIYSLASSFCLHYLMNNWLTTSSIVLWHVDVETNKWLWFAFVSLHSMAWIIICGGCIIMGLPELLGIKQAYYDLRSYYPPLFFKSWLLRNQNAHISHPSFLGFITILWVTNLMTMDRLILAVMLTLYMHIAWSTDKNDLNYQKIRLQRKGKKDLKMKESRQKKKNTK